MATTRDSFSAAVNAWVLKTRRRMEAVAKESAQRVIENMQTPVGAGGNMPVDTGFLRASLAVTIGAPVTAVTFSDGAPRSWSPDLVSFAIAGWDIGEPLFATYGASYAQHVEYGSLDRPGRAFVRLAAMQWPQIIREVVAEAKRRIP